MNKIKLSVGALAFVGLAMLNFTQSESCFVSKALASGGSVSSGSHSNYGSSSTSSSSTSFSSSSSGFDDPNLKKEYELAAEFCTITKTNYEAGFVWNGIPIPIGGSYTVSGVQWICVPRLGFTCDATKEIGCIE